MICKTKNGRKIIEVSGGNNFEFQYYTLHSQGKKIVVETNEQKDLILKALFDHNMDTRLFTIKNALKNEFKDIFKNKKEKEIKNMFISEEENYVGNSFLNKSKSILRKNQINDELISLFLYCYFSLYFKTEVPTYFSDNLTKKILNFKSYTKKNNHLKFKKTSNEYDLVLKHLNLDELNFRKKIDYLKYENDASSLNEAIAKVFVGKINNNFKNTRNKNILKYNPKFYWNKNCGLYDKSKKRSDFIFEYTKNGKLHKVHIELAGWTGESYFKNISNKFIESSLKENVESYFIISNPKKQNKEILKFMKNELKQQPIQQQELLLKNMENTKTVSKNDVLDFMNKFYFQVSKMLAKQDDVFSTMIPKPDKLF